MTTLVFETLINRDIDFIFDNIYKKEVYKMWGQAFSPNPRYDGEVVKGSDIAFGDDINNAMIGTVSELITNEIIEFTYTSQNMNSETLVFDQPIIESYRFVKVEDEITKITITLKILEEFAADLKEMWDAGIIKLKTTLEQLPDNDLLQTEG